MKKQWIFVVFAGLLISIASCKKNPTGPAYTATSSDTIAYWRFDGNANDVSGNGHNASFTGTYSYTSNRFDSADKSIQIIGSGEMDVQNMPNFSDSDSWSISLWVNFSAGGDLVSPNYGFAADTGSFGADLVGCGLLTTKPGPQVDQWHLLTLAVASHNNATLYIDSIEVARKTYGSYSGTNDSMPLSITFNQSGLASDTARLDDAIFLHHCMSLAEVAARFHEGGWDVHTDSSGHKDSTITSDTGSAFHWSSAYPVPSGILGMSWINNGTGFACGKQGAIWKTTDSGMSWQKINQTATQCDLYSIDFMSPPNYGLAVGYSNGPAIIYTTDGGNTWASGPVPAGVATIRDVIYGVYPGTFGLAVGSDSSGHGVILYTDYGGEYWAIDKTTPKPLNAIAMSDPMIDQYHPIVAVGDAGQIFVSTSWKPDTGHAIYTGFTWNDYSTGSENFQAISIRDNPDYGAPFRGIALSDNGSMLLSTDFGVTWAEHSQSVSSYIPNSAIYAAGGSEAWISGSNIARTTDNGVTWKNEDPIAGQTWTCSTGASRVGFLSGAGLYWLIR